MITGLYIPSAGEICFQGESTMGLEPHEITRLGIGRTFQNIRLFPNLTVLDNVRIAYHSHAGYNLVDGVLRNRTILKQRKRTDRASPGVPVNLQAGRHPE